MDAGSKSMPSTGVVGEDIAEINESCGKHKNGCRKHQRNAKKAQLVRCKGCRESVEAKNNLLCYDASVLMRGCKNRVVETKL